MNWPAAASAASRHAHSRRLSRLPPSCLSFGWSPLTNDPADIEITSRNRSATAVRFQTVRNTRVVGRHPRRSVVSHFHSRATGFPSADVSHASSFSGWTRTTAWHTHSHFLHPHTDITCGKTTARGFHGSSCTRELLTLAPQRLTVVVLSTGAPHSCFSPFRWWRRRQRVSLLYG